MVILAAEAKHPVLEMEGIWDFGIFSDSNLFSSASRKKRLRQIQMQTRATQSDPDLIGQIHVTCLLDLSIVVIWCTHPRLSIVIWLINDILNRMTSFIAFNVGDHAFWLTQPHPNPTQSLCIFRRQPRLNEFLRYRTVCGDPSYILIIDYTVSSSSSSSCKVIL